MAQSFDHRITDIEFPVFGFVVENREHFPDLIVIGLCRMSVVVEKQIYLCETIAGMIFQYLFIVYSVLKQGYNIMNQLILFYAFV